MRFLIALVALLGACSSDDIDSNEEARRAYYGLDASIEKSLALGFTGFNTAQSANIAPQMAAGNAGGTLTVTGQVDQGSSPNKGMRLRIGMVDYTEGTVLVPQEDGDDLEVNLVYDTDADVALQPYLELTLRDIPSGTFSGSLTGKYYMTGDIEGEAELSLTFTGKLQPSGTSTVRVPGMTMVTGTAKSGEGTYEVNIAI